MIGAGPARAVISADNSTLYVSNFNSDMIAVYSIDDGKLVANVHVGSRPDALALSPNQNFLFVAGAELATAPEAADRLEDGVSRITDDIADSLDGEIDRYLADVELAPQFTIPGGTQLSAQLDVARAVLRRAERRVVALKQSDGLASEAILRFLNRASDLVFAMARATDEDSPARFAGRDKE